ncbi:hypothetical protein AGOR_G00191910 [Albula goreensis]|uniref:Ubiquitin-like domain-containing protein n=1 Tax=Albula goreensis TaxID=1534307 RepID=A0A8T3CWA9_9TELE|nr:hypothetical protein AGOR_G00191910 [Albula goreensis]
METKAAIPTKFHNSGGVGCAAKGDPPAPVPQPFHTHHKVFQNNTHATLQARSDTVETLKKMFLQERPDLTSKLNLACNGKPALDHQTLAELQLNETAMFVTYKKCIGG